MGPFAYLFKTYLNGQDEILTIIFFSVFGIGSFILASYLSKGKVKITLSEEQIEFEWLKKPFFTPQANRTIKFKNILSWRFRKEPHYKYFIIDINKSEDLTLYRDSIWDNNKDDFGAFMADFKSKVKDYNDKILTTNEQNEKTTEFNHKERPKDSKTLIIDREKKFNKSVGATLLFYIYFLTIIFGLIGLVVKWKDLTGAQPLIIISGLFGCMFLIGQHLKKKKK
jgi:hypothetical protein